MDLIKQLMEATLCPIERPAAYGLFHWLFMIISIALMLTFCILMRNKSDKTFRIVMIVIGAVLLGAELYKHLYYAFAYDKETFNGVPYHGYEWNIVSFQLCSVPMYLSVAVGCMKKCKVRDILCEYIVSIGFLGGIMAYIEPSGILHDDLFCLLHSCIWHGLLILLALYILFTNNACQKLRDYPKAIIVFCGVVVVATILNLCFISKVDEGFNMCYISPFRNTPLAVFKDVTQMLQNLFNEKSSDMLSFGRLIVNIIYILVVPVGGFIVYSGSYGVKKLVSFIASKSKHSKE